MMLLLILLFGLVIFLYFLFTVAKDDFLILRRNITLEQLFNITFIVFFAGILGARIMYVLEHLNIDYLNPLVFFIFPYFPGLSVVGGCIGGISTLWVLSIRKKLPIGHMFDLFSLYFIISWAIGMFFYSFTNASLLFWGDVCAILYVGIFFLLHRIMEKSIFKDASIGFLIFCLFSWIFLFFSLIKFNSHILLHLSLEVILLFLNGMAFLGLFIYNEKFSFGKKKK